MYIDANAIKLENPDVSLNSSSDVQSYLQSVDYSMIDFDTQPMTRIAAEMFDLLAQGFAFYRKDMLVINNPGLWRDTTINHIIFKPAFVSYTYDKESRLDGLLQYLMTKRDITTINYDNQVTEYKESVDTLMASVKEFDESHMTRSMFSHLAKISAFPVIKKNYEYLKTYASAGDSYTFKNMNWVSHLSFKGNLKYGQDIIDNFDYVADLRQIIRDTFEGKTVNLGDQSRAPTCEWVLLAVKADKLNCAHPIESSDFYAEDDLEGDLKSNTRWLEKLNACMKSLSVCQPDKYKALFHTYTERQDGKITLEALRKNPLMVALLAKCSRIRIDEEVLNNFAKIITNTDANPTRRNTWTTTISYTEGWRGIRSIMDYLPVSPTLFACLYNVSHKMRHQPDYDDVLARYAHRIFTAPSEMKTNNADLVDYITARLFEEDDINLAADTLGLSVTDTFNMLYMQKYAKTIEAEPLPELDLNNV